MAKLSELLDSYIYIISNRRIRELTEGGGLRETPFLFAFVFVLAFKHVFALDVQKR